MSFFDGLCNGGSPPPLARQQFRSRRPEPCRRSPAGTKISQSIPPLLETLALDGHGPQPKFPSGNISDRRMRRLPDRPQCLPCENRPSAPGSVNGTTLAHSAGQLVDAVALRAGRAGPAGTRIRAEALASPAPLITQRPVIAKQRQGPPRQQVPRGEHRARVLFT